MVAKKQGHDQGAHGTDGIRRDYPDPLKDWAKIRNEWARDTRLDWDALGLLTWLSTHREGFEVRMRDLYSARASGRESVDSMVRALEEYGYLRRERGRSEGRYVVTVWHLLDPTTGVR